MIELKADRELDALIAEEVMGWRRTNVRLARSLGRDDHGLLRSEDMLVEALVFGEKIHAVKAFEQPNNVEGCPHYSTDIAAAWEVVEKLKGTLNGNDWTGEFNLFYNGEKYECWWSFSRPSEEGLYETSKEAGVASTAPHAICLAALQAINH